MILKRQRMFNAGNPLALVQRMTTSAANATLRPFSMRLVRDDTPGVGYQESAKTVPLPVGAGEYLDARNPRLLQLVGEYEQHPAARHHQWGERQLKSTRLDLCYFRDDNMYVWQRRGLKSQAQYLVSVEYVRRYDRLGLLDMLHEDGCFGAHTFDADGKIISRDLLDSIIELNCLVRLFGEESFSSMQLLDIGAGYGRLAHRAMTAFPNLKPIVCTDAVPTSTFLCEYYLDFRGLRTSAKVVPLPRIAETMSAVPVDLATNIHSFSECRYDSIVWWLDLLHEHEVKHLFLVPNTKNRLVSTERGGSRRDFRPALTERGYELVHVEPKYSCSPATQRYGIYPTNYYLFEKKG